MVALPAAAAEAGTRIAAYPKLYPAFSTSVRDYVSRCQRGRPLLLAAHAPRATRVTLDGRPTRRKRLELAAGQGTRVTIGKRTFHVRCLPRAFPPSTSERHGRTQAGWYAVTPAQGGDGSRFLALFDPNGVPVWWVRTQRPPIDFKVLPDGTVAWSYFTGGTYAAEDAPYEVRRLNGELVRRVSAVGALTDNHELQLLPNGNYLVLSYLPRDGVDLSRFGGPEHATVTDAEVQEVSPGGKLVFRWNSKDHVDLAESAPFARAFLSQPVATQDGRSAYDIVHVNSAEADGDSLIVSLRHTSGVIKISRRTGAVEWKLGGTETPESIRVQGEPAGSLVFSGQHDARVLPDGTITVHDNRTGSGLLARAVRYRIDEQNRTAEQVESLIDPGTSVSLCCGSARKLPRGNWVGGWGFNSLVSELTPGGRRVFGLRFEAPLFSYRAAPVQRGELTARALRRGMDAMHPR